MSGRVGWWAAVLAAALAAGCDGMSWALRKDDGVPPPGAPCQIVATWQNRVLFVPDPANQGKQSPGLACRLYLFGQEVGKPLTGDGSLVAAVYDETKGESLMLETWEIDPATLKRLLKQDMIGWGYTVFLPWGRYRPDITRVRMKLCYRPAKGTPLFTENPVTLGEGNGVLKVTNSARDLSAPAK